MSKSGPNAALGRRERQIMDVVYRLGKASVADVRAALADPPTYSAVRGMLRLLEDKGFVTHEVDGIRFLYAATVGRTVARKSALKHLVHTFFAGSATDAAASLLELPDAKLSDTDIERLARIIKKAKESGQ